MALVLPQTINAGTTISAAEVQENFDAIKTWADALQAGSGTTEDSTYRTIMQGGAIYDSFNTTTLWVLVGDRFVQSGSTAIAGGLSAMYFDDADYTLAGETPVCRLRAQLYVNATAPSATATVGLHNLTACAGTANALTLTANATAVTGSTTAFTTPSASTRNTAVTSDFTVPADGHYIFGVTWSAAAAADNAVGLAAQLQVKVAT